MLITIGPANTPGDLLVRGHVDQDLILDDSNQVQWAVTVSASNAQLLADDVTHRHGGVRFYAVSGVLSHFDDTDVDVHYLGREWGDEPQLVLITNAPGEEMWRHLYDVNVLRDAEPQQFAALLRAVATP